MFKTFYECSCIRLENEKKLSMFSIHWSLLNGITINWIIWLLGSFGYWDHLAIGIIQLMGLIFLRYPRPVWPQ